MDGILRKVIDRTWQGFLNSYRVTVSLGHGGSWHYHVMNPKGHTEIAPPCDSLADGARKARAWAEAHPLLA